MLKNKPAFHYDWQMNTRVKVRSQNIEEEVKGTIVGLANKGVIYNYILELDKPVNSMDYNIPIKVIVVPGTEFKTLE